MGVDVNKQNQYGCTALHLAVSSKQLQMAATLIDRPETEINKERIKNPRYVVEMIAKCNEEGLMRKLVEEKTRSRVDRNSLKNSLFIAAISGNDAIIEAILEQLPGLTDSTDDVGNTALMVAARNHHVGSVELLTSKFQADVHIKNHLLETVFDLAMRQPNNQLLQYLMQQTSSNELLKPVYLHTAAANGDNEKIEFILQTVNMPPLQLDADDNTIFHTAAAHDAYQVEGGVWVEGGCLGGRGGGGVWVEEGKGVFGWKRGRGCLGGRGGGGVWVEEGEGVFGWKRGKGCLGGRRGGGVWVGKGEGGVWVEEGEGVFKWKRGRGCLGERGMFGWKWERGFVLYCRSNRAKLVGRCVRGILN